MRSGRVAKEGGVGPDRSTESAVCVLAKAQDQERTHGTGSVARKEARPGARPRDRLPRSHHNSRTSRRTNPKRCTSRSSSGKSATVPSTAVRRPDRRRSGSAFADVPPDQPARAVEAHNDGSGLARRANRRMPIEQAPGAPQSSSEKSTRNLVVSETGRQCQLVQWKAEHLAVKLEPASQLTGPEVGAMNGCVANFPAGPARSRLRSTKLPAGRPLHRLFEHELCGASCSVKDLMGRAEKFCNIRNAEDFTHCEGSSTEEMSCWSRRAKWAFGGPHFAGSQASHSSDDDTRRSVQDARATRYVCARRACRLGFW